MKRLVSVLVIISMLLCSMVFAQGAFAVSATTSQLNDICWNGSIYVAVGNGGTIIWGSGTASTWTAVTSGTTANLNGVAWDSNDSVFLAVGDNGTALQSSNGVNWTKVTTNTTVKLNNVTFDGVYLVSVGDGGKIFAYFVNDAWIPAKGSGTTQNLNSVVYDQYTTVSAVGNAGAFTTTSDPTQTWSSKVTGINTNLNDVTYDSINNRRVIAVGPNRSVYLLAFSGTVTAGTTPGGTYDLNGVTWNYNLSSTGYAAVGTGGTIITSANGSTWSLASSPTTNTLNDIVYGNGNYVAVGNAGTIVASSNGGVTWTVK